MDCSSPGSSVHGILQATILERATWLWKHKILDTTAAVETPAQRSRGWALWSGSWQVPSRVPWSAVESEEEKSEEEGKDKTSTHS